MNETSEAAPRGGLWAAMFGVWTAPPWLRRVGAQEARAVAAVRARPRASGAVLVALIAIVVGGWFGHAWWQARPKPVEVSVKTSGPAITDFANNGAPQPMTLVFSNSVAPLALVGKDVTSSIALTPPIEGTWHWDSDRQLAFTPKAEWPVGTEFKVTLAADAVAPQIRLVAREFTFTSALFQPTLRKAEFYQDPVNPAIKKVEIEVGFTHPVNTVEFEKRIELRLGTQAEGTLGIGRETTPFTVTYDKFKLSAYVHSAVLAIPKESTELHFKLDKGATRATGRHAQRDGPEPVGDRAGALQPERRRCVDRGRHERALRARAGAGRQHLAARARARGREEHRRVGAAAAEPAHQEGRPDRGTLCVVGPARGHRAGAEARDQARSGRCSRRAGTDAGALVQAARRCRPPWSTCRSTARRRASAAT